MIVNNPPYRTHTSHNTPHYTTNPTYSMKSVQMVISWQDKSDNFTKTHTPVFLKLGTQRSRTFCPSLPLGAECVRYMVRGGTLYYCVCV